MPPPPLLPEHFECLEHSHRLLPRYKQFRVSLVSSSNLKNLKNWDDFFYLFLDNRLHYGASFIFSDLSDVA